MSTMLSVSTQSPGSTTLSVAQTGHNPPSRLEVTNRCYDDNSELVAEETVALDGWVENTADGWTAFVTFAGNSGLSCFAFVHRDNSDRALAAVSYEQQ